MRIRVKITLRVCLVDDYCRQNGFVVFSSHEVRVYKISTSSTSHSWTFLSSQKKSYFYLRLVLVRLQIGCGGLFFLYFEMSIDVYFPFNFICSTSVHKFMQGAFTKCLTAIIKRLTVETHNNSCLTHVWLMFVWL